MKKLYIIFILITLTITAFAQTHSITGKVMDSLTQKSLSYATITVTSDGKSPIKTTYTKNEGTFLIGDLKSSKYVLIINYTGYNPKSIAVDLTDSTKKATDLGTIYLTGQNQQLKEVSISASKPLIKQEVDRISYDLQADPDSKGSNVLEMLKKVPFVSLDGNDNILLKGNSSYKILINGKPSSMMERDPVNILRSMPASTIQRIEVITTPPAKYDAEGIAGIINIITNKKIDNGYNGTLNISERYPGGPNLGTSFTVKEGKLGISGYGGGNIYDQPITTSFNTRTTSGTDPTNLTQQGNTAFNSHSGYFGTELSYEIDSLNLISGQFNINGNKQAGNTNQASLLTDQSGILQGFDLANAYHNKGNGTDVSLNYQLGFKRNKSRLLTFSYRYWEYNNTNIADLSATDRVNYTTPDYNQDDHTTASEQTLQVDYVESFKKWSIEAGVKGIFRNNLSDFQYDAFNQAANQFLLDTALSNKYTDTQNIWGAYNSWQYRGKNWGIKAGLRVEETVTNADFISTASVVHQNYLNIFPSLAANWDFKDNSGINFGFSQRLRRPGINRLNPFIDRSNPDFQSSGNPNLQPVLVNDLNFGYHFTKKASVNIGLTYDFGKNLDLQVSSFDPATNITFTTYQNVGKVAGFGGFLNVNYPITKQLNLSLNGNVMHFWLNGFVGGVLQSNNFFAGNIVTSAGYSFKGDWRVSAEFDITGRNPTGLQGGLNAFTASSFSVNKQIIKNKLTLSAAIRNPFTQYRTSTLETSGPGFAQTNLTQIYFRSYTVSLNYNFGKLKDGVKKTRRNIRNDDGAN